jgi:hypothetical protein
MKVPIIPILCLCLCAGACGHRGHLYLPGKPGDPALGRSSGDARAGEPARRSGTEEGSILQDEARR